MVDCAVSALAAGSGEPIIPGCRQLSTENTSCMLKKKVKDVSAFVAGDKTLIREVLHPKNETINLPYSLAYAVLPPGRSSEPHILEASSEVYIFVRGSGQVFVNEETTPAEPGVAIHIPAGATQYVTNEGETNLEFWCIVAPPWSANDELVM